MQGDLQPWRWGDYADVSPHHKSTGEVWIGVARMVKPPMPLYLHLSGICPRYCKHRRREHVRVRENKWDEFQFTPITDGVGRQVGTESQEFEMDVCRFSFA